jgi:hypothetical protein
MKLIFGYKDHTLRREKWYRILVTVFMVYNVAGLALFSWLTIRGTMSAPNGWIFILFILLIALIVWIFSINIIRYIFLYTVLGPDKKK